MSIEDKIALAAAAQAQSGAVVPATVPGRVCHIDGDYLAYFVAAISDNPGRARQVIHQYVDNFKMFSGSARVQMHLTAPGSTKGERRLVATVKGYQVQRSGEKPAMWEWVREYLTNYQGFEFGLSIWADREADDGIAYMSDITTADLMVIATRDKDMRMLSGWHLDWQTYEMRWVGYDAFNVVHGDLQYGHKWFWLQLLQGDTADNIPGLPKYELAGKLKPIGPATAEKLLSKVRNNQEAYDICLLLYQTYYHEEAHLMLAEQAMLLWLRRDGDARLGDFLRVCPDDGLLSLAVQQIEDNVRKIHAEVDSFTSQAVPQHAVEEPDGDVQAMWDHLLGS